MQYVAHGDYNTGTETAHHAYEQDQQADYDAQHESEHAEWPDYRSDGHQYGQAQTNGDHRHDNGYSVASGHDYLGYPKEQRGYSNKNSNSNDHTWDDEESEDLW